MILSTLPDLPGGKFHVRGIVYCEGVLDGVLLGSTSIDEMLQYIAKQASHLGADAIVDIKVIAPGGTQKTYVVIGTAVKLIPNP